jgi:hypothetical protein
MAIPDEVAQYAEGHRIVSYFALGSVQDGDEKKSTWLWTTIGGGGQSYDFDSLRVFVWSLRHRRYETAYVEHNLQGYEPVLLKEVELAGVRGKSAGKYPGFSACIQKRDGQKYRQEFALLGNIVRFAGEQPCEAGAPILPQMTAAALPGTPATAARNESWWQRLKGCLRRLTGR